MARSENNLNAVLQDTANAIKSKKGTNDLICPRDFADEISTIETGIEPTGTKEITANASQINIREYEYVDVNVPNPSTGTKNITENGVYDVTSFASANVNVSGSTPTGTLYITEDGDYNVTNYAMASVNVSQEMPAVICMDGLFYNIEEIGNVSLVNASEYEGYLTIDASIDCTDISSEYSVYDFFNKLEENYIKQSGSAITINAPVYCTTVYSTMPTLNITLEVSGGSGWDEELAETATNDLLSEVTLCHIYDVTGSAIADYPLDSYVLRVHVVGAS